MFFVALFPFNFLYIKSQGEIFIKSMINASLYGEESRFPNHSLLCYRVDRTDSSPSK